jgi:hypothetical protein
LEAGVTMTVRITNKEAFLRGIIDEAGSVLEKTFFGLSDKTLKKIQALVPSWVMNSKEISDLRARKDIWAQLGVPDNILDQAINDIARLSATTVGFQFNRRNVADIYEIGKIEVFVRGSAMDRFLTLDSGKYLTKKGIEIPWLKSLLLDGTKIIVTDFTYVPKESPSSRTGGGIMISSPGSYWRVPTAYSGTINNNFITRSIEPHMKELQKIVLDDLRKGFNVV